MVKELFKQHIDHIFNENALIDILYDYYALFIDGNFNTRFIIHVDAAPNFKDDMNDINAFCRMLTSNFDIRCTQKNKDHWLIETYHYHVWWYSNNYENADFKQVMIEYALYRIICMKNVIEKKLQRYIGL